MGGCGNCGGDCSHCSGCGAALTLNEGELHLLRKLGQIPFLPVAASADAVPIYLGEGDYPAQEYSLILQCLEKKNLISIDLSTPLKGFSGYGDYPRQGSIGLTARGIQILELLEIQGVLE